jgi:hypothetical protein
VGYDAASGSFVPPDAEVRTEEVFNRAITAAYLVHTADCIFQVLEEDPEFRYRALSELALRACREWITPARMKRTLEEFAARSEQHKALEVALDARFEAGNSFFAETICRAKEGRLD